jgi:hypothetical protein
MERWAYYSFDGDNPGNVHMEFENGKLRTTYEYLDMLNEDGWELITAIRINQDDPSSNSYRYFLKRPLED